MKLYVKNSEGRAIPLDIVAVNKYDLANKIGSNWFTIEGEQYHVNKVYAVKTTNNLSTGAIIGGLIGLIFGPEGLVVGGLLGGALGGVDDSNDQKSVDQFNQSKVL